MVFLWNILPNESGSRTNVNICKMENDFLICLLKINFGHKCFLIYSHICMRMHAFKIWRSNRGKQNSCFDSLLSNSNL